MIVDYSVNLIYFPAEGALSNIIAKIIAKNKHDRKKPKIDLSMYFVLIL
jgi:hypothetical protein